MSIEDLRHHVDAIIQYCDALLVSDRTVLTTDQLRMVETIQRVSKTYLQICSYEGWDEMSESFITNVCHELRTPLTPMRGYADLLLMQGRNLTTAQQATLEAIVDRVDDITAWVDHFIDLANLDFD